MSKMGWGYGIETDNPIEYERHWYPVYESDNPQGAFKECVEQYADYIVPMFIAQWIQVGRRRLIIPGTKQEVSHHLNPAMQGLQQFLLDNGIETHAIDADTIQWPNNAVANVRIKWMLVDDVRVSTEITTETNLSGDVAIEIADPEFLPKILKQFRRINFVVSKRQQFEFNRYCHESLERDHA